MLATRLRLLAVLFLAVLGLGASSFTAGSASAGSLTAGAASCTHTSSGSCIRGGQFCPQASYGVVGTDAQGRRYVCSGDRTHPHWEVTGSGGTTHKYSGHTLSAGDGYGPDGRYKPRRTYLSGDATLTMYKSTWSKWTKTRAVAKGVGHFDTCAQSCADGPILKIKMTLVESAPRYACGKRYFTHYRVTFARKPDKYTPKSYTLVRSITCG